MGSLKKVIVVIISVIAVLTFYSNYQICEYFHSNDLNKWWDLRLNLYSLIFLLLSIVLSITYKRHLRNFFIVFTCLCFGDIIDRVLFNITTFETNDYYFIALVIILYTYLTYNVWNRGQKSIN